VRDSETGLRTRLDADPIPITDPLPPPRLVFQHHPRIGWHCLAVNVRSGYPLHYLHVCTRERRP
jgi:hypothetical protein